MRRVMTMVVMLGLMLLAASAGAVPVQVDFSYRVNFIDEVAGAALGLQAGDAVTGRTFVDLSLLDAAGDGTLPGDPFHLTFGALSFQASDDIFGGPVVEFVSGTPRAFLFDTGFSFGGDDYFLELGLTLTGEAQLRLTSAVGALLGAGPLVAVAVPGPATLGTVVAGLLLVAALRPRGWRSRRFSVRADFQP